MVSLTTIVGVDDVHLAELKLVWPTWKRHRPELFRHKLLLLCDAAQKQADWEKSLRFVDHPDKEIVLWESTIADQREKMLTGLVLSAAQHVQTPWYLKLDTDAAAVAPGAWLDPAWFAADEAGRLPAFVSSPWSYTKPADAIEQLDRWAATIPELAAHPPLELYPNPGWSRVVHPRIISWCFFGNTEWTRRMAAFCGDRLPVPSQDTFLWYCAARRKDFYLRIRMSDFGWQHFGCRRRLRRACDAALRSKPSVPPAATPISVAARIAPEAKTPPKPDEGLATTSNQATAPANHRAPRRYSRHAQSLFDLLTELDHESLQGAEIGVAEGETSRALLERFPKLQLWMVDSWNTFDEADPYYLSGDSCARLTAQQQSSRADVARQATAFAEKRRTIVAQDSVPAATAVAPKSLDFVFIDADHTYEGVKKDIDAWWSRVRPGGIMIGHDYGGLRNRLGLFGVSAAVDEFARKQRLEVRKHPGLVWSIRRPDNDELSTSKRIVDTNQASARTDRGVVYLLTGAAHADRLVVSLWSLRKHYDGPVTVYTTQPESHEIGRLCAADGRLNVEHRTAEQARSRKNSTFLTKLEIFPHVPYDTALYFDADTLIVGDPSSMFELDGDRSFGVTQFSNWITSGRIMRRRLEAWRKLRLRRRHRAWVESLVTEGVKSHPAINTGVVSFRRGSEILKPWLDLSRVGYRSFICEEIAMQLLAPGFRHKLFDCRFNCSPIHAQRTADVRVWHFHGEKHLRREQGRALWLPAYEECLRERVARVHEWTRTAPQVAELNLVLS